MRDKPLLLLFRIYSRIFLFFPEYMRFYFIKILSRILYIFAFKHKKIIDANLDFVSDIVTFSNEERKEIKKYCFYNMLLWFKSIIENLYDNEVKYEVSFKNRYFYDDALKNGDNIILISAHYGNIEVLGDALNRHFCGMTLDDKIIKSFYI